MLNESGLDQLFAYLRDGLGKTHMDVVSDYLNDFYELPGPLDNPNPSVITVMRWKEALEATGANQILNDLCDGFADTYLYGCASYLAENYEVPQARTYAIQAASGNSFFFQRSTGKFVSRDGEEFTLDQIFEHGGFRLQTCSSIVHL